MNASIAPPTARPAADQAPQLRTLLLTDLCDSTALVERIGDVAAAALFREHDRLVLALQQQWHGRLIDRSDGLLLLFERPIDGLGFALDYTRGLRDLGAAHQVELKARSGLHVGEVLTWRNSEEAVRVGAKPLEVEGLAKPMAGRLMATARPGQILLSAVAEPLAHRSARELGERGLGLLWKSYGRWRFKGVPEAQEIFEVGEPGIAPLRAPPATPKAWRDIPLWRRPAALAAEVAVLAVLGLGLWWATRPQPAIAFANRDWVVVADLRNLTGNHAYDDAVETVLRIALEQSRHVNVVADARVDETLQGMGLDPAKATLDRNVASEIAVRDGVRAVLLPTVADVGGQLKVTLEVVDPATQATVFTETATGRGPEAMVNAVGEASDALRQRLGEALASVQASSAPLDRATTANLDALRAYGLGQAAYATQDLDAAEQHFRQALALDPGFAMARIGLSRIAYTRTDVPAALSELSLALRDTSRLTDRERLYAKAQLAQLRLDRDALEQWQALSKLYPDFHVAAFNTANLLRFANRYRPMRDYARQATARQAVTRPAAWHYLGIADAALGDAATARRDFDAARKAGFPPVFIEPALLEAAQRHPDKALALLPPTNRLPPPMALEHRMARMTIAADAGRWPEAKRVADELAASTREPRQAFEWAARAAVLAVRQHDASPTRLRADAEALLNQAAVALPQTVGRTRESVAAAALYAGYVAAGWGDEAAVRRAVDATRPVVAQSPFNVLANFVALTQARLALQQGDAARARQLLQPHQSEDALLLTRYWQARADGRPTAAPAPASAATRLRAYGEWAAERPPVLEALLPLSGRK
ncbi:putative peptide modification system cyclase [Aerolutibacter daejeonensis]|uniref:putative peptide modification system cyclase n=1 Tax=Aerolutibacter daejeonensis TaxID=346181 RepID=UPI00068AD8BE|nr:putative peptide modification system cyclase [Lysobacter daejeonensis]